MLLQLRLKMYLYAKENILSIHTFSKRLCRAVSRGIAF